MILFPELIKNIYLTSQLIAGIAGFVIFILVLKSTGFDSRRTVGNKTEILIGSGFILSILVTLLSVGPLFIFDEEYKYAMPVFPTEFFKQSFWIIYLFILIGSVVAPFLRKRKISPYYLIVPVISLPAASWVAKTMGVMAFIFQTQQINLFLKMLFECYCVVMLAIYLAIPVVSLSMLPVRDKKP